MQVNAGERARTRCVRWLGLAAASVLILECMSQPEQQPEVEFQQPTYDVGGGQRKTVARMSLDERKAVLPALESGCVQCHADSRDPHPGAPKATCVDCH